MSLSDSLRSLPTSRLRLLQQRLGLLEHALTPAPMPLHESKDITKNRTTKIRQLFLDLAYPQIQFDPTHASESYQQLSALRGRYLTQLREAFAASEGELGAVWEQMQKAVAESFEQARLLGLQSTGFKLPLESTDQTAVSGAITEELDYLGKFLGDHLAERGGMPFEQRLTMYGRALDGIYHAGAVAGMPRDTLIYWRLGIAEHCKTCPRLAAGSPYTKATLPAVPRSGHTDCLSNCRCALVYEWRGTQMGSAPMVGAQITEIKGQPVTFATLAQPPVRQLQDQLNQLYRRMSYFRQMMEITEGAERSAYIVARKQVNAQLIALTEQRQVRVIPRASVAELVDAVSQLRAKGYLPLTERPAPGAAVYVLEGLDGSRGVVQRVGASSLRLRMDSGAGRTVALDDADNTLLWVTPGTPTFD